MEEIQKCPTCGHAIMRHKHRFSNSLAQIFIQLSSKFGERAPFHLQKDFTFTKNQYNNFQKLQYWGLVEKCFIKSQRVGGYWQLTHRADALLRGGDIPHFVVTFQNKVVEESEYKIRLEDSYGAYDLPKVWAERASNRIEQPSLF